MRQITSSCFILAMVLALGCGGRQTTHHSFRTEAGSCEATCDHYEQCKGAPDPQREQACQSECRNIFSEDGRVDSDSLRELQQLSCPQLLAFIEGPASRAIQASE